MGYCSSGVEAKDKLKGIIQSILRYADITGGKVILTGGGGHGIIMNSWLIDLFANVTTVASLLS